MRKQLKILISALMLLAFAGQAAGAHACISAIMSPSGPDVHTSMAPMNHGDNDPSTDSSGQPHCYDCTDDCNGVSNFSGDPSSVANAAQTEAGKFKSYANTLPVTRANLTSVNRLRGPPLTLKSPPLVSTTLLSQRTHLLI